MVMSETSLQSVLDALLDESRELTSQHLYRLSDLEEEEIQELEAVWDEVPLQQRRSLLEDLEELTAQDMVLSYEHVCRTFVKDDDPLVRLPAVRILWEFEAPDLIPLFVDLMETDPEVGVRSSAASALGRFVYLGEVEELAQEQLRLVVRRLLDVIEGFDHPLVRRRALESLGYSSHDRVPTLIEEAFTSGDDEWIASALFAMGRSADPNWRGEVLGRLDDLNPNIRFEAVRAAGELELDDASPTLLELLDDPSDSVRLASIWALSQVGGQGVRASLNALLRDTEDEVEADLIADALDNLTFTEGFDQFSLFDFDEDIEEEASSPAFGDDLD